MRFSTMPSFHTVQLKWRGGYDSLIPQFSHSSHPDELSNSREDLECYVLHMLLIQTYLFCQGQEPWTMEAEVAGGAEARDYSTWRPGCTLI